MVFMTSSDKDKDYQFLGKCVPPFQINAALSDSWQDYLSRLQVASKASVVRLSGIICTIGIACLHPDKLEQLIDSGMNIAYINLAHGDLDYHTEMIKNIKIARGNYNKKIKMMCPVSIALGLKGPAIRCYPGGNFCTEITVYEGNLVNVSGDLNYIYQVNPQNSIYINYENLHEVLKIGSEINIAENRTILSCISVENLITCQVVKGGDIRSGDRIHLPETSLNLPVLTAKDRAYLQLAIEENVDIIFVPYTRNGDCLHEVRNFLGEKGKEMMICAQIDNEQGFENIDEIIEAADGILICRESLGNEVKETTVFLLQKTIIAKCNAAGKPVICSFHLLESMVKNPVPTRAERCDVANAIIDGADCILLYHETYNGYNANKCVTLAGRICKEAEAALWQKKVVTELYDKIIPPVLTIDAIAIAAVQISFILLAPAIIVISSSLKSAEILSHYKPKCPIVTVTRNKTKTRHAHLFRGILPVLCKKERKYNWAKDVEMRVYIGLNFGRKQGFIRVGETVVVLTASKQGSGFTDKMKILKVIGHSLGRECTC